MKTVSTSRRLILLVTNVQQPLLGGSYCPVFSDHLLVVTVTIAIVSFLLYDNVFLVRGWVDYTTAVATASGDGG